MRLLTVVLVGLLCLTSLWLPSASKATIRPVPFTYETIQEAVDSSAVGDTIQITDAATYSAFTTDKGLLIESTGATPPTVMGSVLCQTRGTIRRLNLRNTAYSGGTGVIRFAPTNYDDTLRVENCELKGIAGQIASTGISLDTGPVIFKDCVMDSLLHVSFGLTYQAGAGVLRLENCLIRTRHGMGIGAGLNELVGSTMVCAYDTVDTEAAFVVTGLWGINCKVIRSIVDGFDKVFSSCPSESVAYNIFNDYTSLGCASVDPDSNLIGVDPLFCNERETPVGKYTFRIDTPAIAANNDFGVDIGKQLGVECAWGTLARDATVGEGTVYVLEDVTVPSGNVLTVAGGADLRFDDDDNSSSGSDTSLNELVVNGGLVVNGAVGDTVKFRSAAASTAEDDWLGVIVNSASANVDINFAEVKNAQYGIYSSNADTAITIQNSRFADNLSTDLKFIGTDTSMVITVADNTIDVGGGTGVYFEKIYGTISGNVLEGDGTSVRGIYVNLGGSSVEIEGNELSGFDNGYGLDVATGDPLVTGNTFEDNKYGLYVRGGAAEIGVDSTSAANTITGNTRGISTTCTGAGTCPTCSGFNPHIRNCNITENYYGVVTEKRGNLVNMGEGGDRGVNNIYDNTSYCVWNRSVCANDEVWAVGNYWGGCDENEMPVACWEGDIIADGFKCAGPDAFHLPMGIVELKPFRVLGVVPNPVTRSAQVQFAIAGEGARVGVRIFDVTGRLVRTIQEQHVNPGVHELTWDGRTEAGSIAGAGIYFVRVTANNREHETVKVLVLR